MAGRLDATETLTLKHLRDAGLIHKRVKDGVKLLGQARICSRVFGFRVEERVGLLLSCIYEV